LIKIEKQKKTFGLDIKNLKWNKTEVLFKVKRNKEVQF
jgi:hypothetical protein